MRQIKVSFYTLTAICAIIIFSSILNILLIRQNQYLKNQINNKRNEAQSIPITNNSGWEIYKNSYFDFEIAYPKESMIRQDLSLFKVHTINELSAFSMGLSVNQNEDMESVDDYVKNDLCGGERINEETSELWKNAFEGCYQGYLDTKQEVNIAGAQGIMGTYNPYELPITFALIKNDDYHYYFTNSGQETGSNPTELGKDTFNKIVNSFTFADKISDPTEGWKTYSNSYFGYKFNYRPDLPIKDSAYFQIDDDLYLWVEAYELSTKDADDYLNNYCESNIPSIDFYYLQTENNRGDCYEIKNIRISGLEGIEGYETDGKAIRRFALIKQGNKVFHLTLASSDNGKLLSEKSEIIFEKIKDNFKYTGDKYLQVKLYYNNYYTDPTLEKCESNDFIVDEVIDNQDKIEETIKLLIREGEIEKHADFRLADSSLENGILTLTFPDIPSYTSGGSCRVNILREAFEKTAKQFPEVKEVRFEPESIFQP